MNKKKIIATYLISKVIERQIDVFDRMEDVIDRRGTEMTKEQIINNIGLWKSMLEPLELEIIEAMGLLGIESNEIDEDMEVEFEEGSR